MISSSSVVNECAGDEQVPHSDSGSLPHYSMARTEQPASVVTNRNKAVRHKSAMDKVGIISATDAPHSLRLEILRVAREIGGGTLTNETVRN